MFLLIFSCSCDLEPQYSLISPFKQTNATEFGNWSFKGSVVNRKNYLMLTTHASNDWGALFQRVPTSFQNWEFETEIEVKGDIQGGNVITFYFSDIFCPEITLNWTGFFIKIDIPATDADNNTPIKFGNISYPFELPPEDIAYGSNIRNSEEHFRFTVRKEGESLTVSIKDNVVYSVHIENLLKFGYFSIVALGGEKIGNDNNIYSFNVTSLSDHVIPESELNVSSINRKIIDNNLLQRRILKRYRRSRQPSTEYYFNTLKASNSMLDGLHDDLHDAFRLIEESDKRAEIAASMIFLGNWIDKVLKELTNKAEKKSNYAFNEFTEIRDSVNILWSELRQQLSSLAFESRAQMTLLKEDSIKIAENLKLQLVKLNETEDALNLPDTKQDSIITTILVIIMVVEAITYLAFFLIKRSKTNDFKKID